MEEKYPIKYWTWNSYLYGISSVCIYIEEIAVEQGDYSLMERLLDVLSKPYAHSPEQAHYATLPEESTRPYRIYCGT